MASESQRKEPSSLPDSATPQTLTSHSSVINNYDNDINFSENTVAPSEIPGGKSPSQSTEEGNLGESIRAALQRSAVREGKDFLPINELERIVTRLRVHQELAKFPQKIPLGKLEYITDKVWGIQSLPSSKSPSGTTRRKILAILILMDKAGEITDFIEEDIFDSDLPFILSEGSRPGLRQLDRKVEDGILQPIQAFSNWRTHEMEGFENYQWELLAPEFHLSSKLDPEIRHYDLEDKRILPFIEDHVVKHAGGFGDVWRVKIHPAHYHYCEDSVLLNSNPPYAVKKLRHSDDEAFEAEVSNLKRFSERDHLHLIKLLVTFKLREQYYLLFPWADGNLQDFWKKYPSTSDLQRGYELTMWLAEQCLGIAQGLKMIHTLDKPTTEDPEHDSPHQIHGRHGDLKPENILWFREYQDRNPNNSMGVLKISDFGLTRFHGSMSKSHINAEGVAVTGTYRAPEYDVNKEVSQSYDIWTLGCVFLEFATWYLLGWDEVDKFSKERTKEHVSELKEDVFFNFVSMKDRYGIPQIGARAKVSVADEFQNLYQHKDCSDFILDLLQFIETKLLRMNSKNRAQCSEIVDKFTELYEYCKKDPSYCTLRLKKAPARSTTEYSLLTPAAVEFSRETEKRINRNSLPPYKGPVETDLETHDTKHFGTNSSQTSSRDLGRTDQEPDGMETEIESRAPSPPPSSSSNSDPRSRRPQSPLRNAVHFSSRKSSLPDIQAEDEKPLETTQSLFMRSNPHPDSPTSITDPSAGSTKPFREAAESKQASVMKDSTTSKPNPPMTKKLSAVAEVPVGDSIALDPPVGDNPSVDGKNSNTTYERKESETNKDSNMPNSSAADHNAFIIDLANGQNTTAEVKKETSGNNSKSRSHLKSFFRNLWCFCNAD